jgi:hypothetical protein
MPKRRQIIGVLTGGSLAVGLYVLLLSYREPTVEGHPLSYWTARLRTVTHPEIRQQAKQAVRQLGTNAVPYLVKRATYQRPACQAAFREALTRFFLERIMDGEARLALDRGDALQGLAALGPEASAAVPELEKLIKDHRSIPKARMAAAALGYTGAAGIPLLLTALTNACPDVRYAATNALLTIAPEALTNAPPQ